MLNLPVMKSKQLLAFLLIHYILTRLDTLYFLLVGSTPYLLMLPKFTVVNRATRLHVLAQGYINMIGAACWKRSVKVLYNILYVYMNIGLLQGLSLCKLLLASTINW